MLTKIRDFFNTELPNAGEDSLNRDQRQLASAALLIEVASADSHFSREELDKLKVVLSRKFDLDKDRLAELTGLAEAEQEQATSLYQFTQLINEQCTPEEKYQLVRGMWEVAFADGRIDKYEEHLIRRVADLIHLPHSQFIRAKLQAKDDS